MGRDDLHQVSLRFNMFVAIALTIIGLVWFVLAQLRPKRTYTVLPPGTPEEAGAVDARPDEAAAARETAAGADIAPEGTIVKGAAGEDNPGAVPEAAAAVNPGPGEADGPGETTARSDD